MTTEPVPPGRRERNKREKLERIIAAASALFESRGVDDVTTQEIADAADIGTGTLFLYAKTKGELLLLVQNARYAEALEAGQRAAMGETDLLQALIAVVAPIIECNRKHVGNGRTYLREMVFGDGSEPHHAAALDIAAQSEATFASIAAGSGRYDDPKASAIARMISALMFVTMASEANAARPTPDLVADIRSQLAQILGRA